MDRKSQLMNHQIHMQWLPVPLGKHQQSWLLLSVRFWRSCFLYSLHLDKPPVSQCLRTPLLKVMVMDGNVTLDFG